MLVSIAYLFIFTLWSTALIIPQKRADLDTVEHGPYTIVNCGATNATAITTSLDNLATYLTPAIKDANTSSTIPSHAYTTFFKDRASSSFVSAVLTNVSTGPPMYQSNHYSNGAPVFACLQEPTQLIYENTNTQVRLDAFSQCQQNPTLASFIIANTSFIVICPSFFTPPPSNYPLSVPAPSKQGSSAADCLKVDAASNHFIGDGTSMTTFMPWLLLEEITNYYIFATNTKKLSPGNSGAAANSNGTYDINQCAGLTPRQSVQNAHNFVYYVANIYAQCTDFPSNSSSTSSSLSTTVTDQGREILAENQNTYPAGIVNGMRDVTLGGYHQATIVSARID